jgi:transcriptional regulator with XRE-family HTH domain
MTEDRPHGRSADSPSDQSDVAMESEPEHDDPHASTDIEAPALAGASAVGGGAGPRFLGAKLRVLMGYHGISNYRELSRRSGVGFETLRLIHTGESANPSIRSLYPLARLYEVPIEALVNDDISVQEILSWVGVPLDLIEPERRIQCANIRKLVRTLGLERVTHVVTAHYFEGGALRLVAIGRQGEIVYHGEERRRSAQGRVQETERE